MDSTDTRAAFADLVFTTALHRWLFQDKLEMNDEFKDFEIFQVSLQIDEDYQSKWWISTPPNGMFNIIVLFIYTYTY